MFENVKFENGANEQTAKEIIKRIKSDIAFRENEILKNLASVENNKDVPAGYVQYKFYDKEGNGFQAGKYANGSYGISL